MKPAAQAPWTTRAAAERSAWKSAADHARALQTQLEPYRQLESERLALTAMPPAPPLAPPPKRMALADMPRDVRFQVIRKLHHTAGW